MATLEAGRLALQHPVHHARARDGSDSDDSGDGRIAPGRLRGTDPAKGTGWTVLHRVALFRSWQPAWQRPDKAPDAAAITVPAVRKDAFNANVISELRGTV